MAIRASVFAREPRCVACLGRGQLTLAEEVDHIIPLHHGGTDDPDNLQGLCKLCHKEKTVSEHGGQYAASNHPEWLELSAIPLTIVCGPPASGKTTFVNENAKPNDTVICLDTIMAELDPSFKQWRHRHPKGIFNSAIRERNRRLGLLKKAKDGNAWFIVSAPTNAEREWWLSKLGGKVVLIDPGPDECKRRALARGTPRAVAGVNSWHTKSRQRWAPKTPKVRPEIGLDGWPVG